jgi:hypothetical protein
MDSFSQLLIILGKLVAEAEDRTALRIRTLLSKPPFNYVPEGNMSAKLGDTLTLLEQLAEKLVAEEVQEDEAAKAQVQDLQKQIEKLSAEAVTEQQMARLDALRDQLAAMLPADSVTPPIAEVPPVDEPVNPPDVDVPPAIPGNPTEESPVEAPPGIINE